MTDRETAAVEGVEVGAAAPDLPDLRLVDAEAVAD